MNNNNTRKTSIVNQITKSTLFVLLLSCIFFSLHNCKSTPNQDVDVMSSYYNKNEKQLDNLIGNLTTFGMADGEKNKKDSLKNALVLFKKGDYKNSRKVLSDYLTNYGEDDYARYYLGLSLMNMGQYGKAIKQFMAVDRYSNFEDMHWLKYNTALCFLKQENTASRQEAKKILESIKNDIKFLNTDKQVIETMIEFCN